jgi:hypothetical protein
MFKTLSGLRVTRSLVFSVVFVDHCLPFCPFSCAIVLYILLRLKNYKPQRQKLNFLRKLLHTLDQSYGMNFRFRYGASSHNAFKTKVKSLILNDDVP